MLTQEQITKEFGFNHGPESIINQMDVVHGFKWDSITYDAGGTMTRHNSDMFRVPVGLPSPTLPGMVTKTMADTNMSNGSRLDPPEMFSIKRIIFTFARYCDDRDVYAVLESYMYRFWLGNKTYSSAVLITLPTTTVPVAPIRTCEYCRSVYANQEACPRCGATHFTLSGLGESNGTQYVMELAISQPILNQMSFHLDFDGHDYTFGSRFKMWCHFEGLHARGVQ